MKNLTLIIPAKNEAESLPSFLNEIQHLDINIIVILQEDDKDTQNSIKNLPNIKILIQKINGYGGAIIEGLNNSKTDYLMMTNQ